MRHSKLSCPIIFGALLCATASGAQAQPAFPEPEFSPYVLFQADGGLSPSADGPGDGSNVRRARLGGTLDADAVAFTLIGEFAGTPGSDPEVYEGSLALRPSDAFQINVGVFETKFSLDEGQGDANVLFLETPASVSLSQGIASGSQRLGVEGVTGGERWLASLAFTGGVATPGGDDDHRGLVTRIAGLAIERPDFDLHLGFSGSTSWRFEQEAGVEGVSLDGGPELAIRDWSSPFGAGFVPADRVHVASLELGGASGRLWWQGEAAHVEIDRPTGGSAHVQGGYVQAAYMVSGNPREWSSSSAAWVGPDLDDRRFDPAAGEWGAFEIAGRYSILDLTASGLDGGRQQVGTVGFSWWPQDPFRFIVQAQRTRIDRLGDPAEFSQFAGRFQVSF